MADRWNPKKAAAEREVWRSQRVRAAVSAMNVFMASPTYKNLWDLRLRLCELLPPDYSRKPFMWAALSGNTVLATGARADVLDKSKAAGVPDPVLWLVTDTAKYTGGPPGFEFYCENGIVGVRQRCPRCSNVIEIMSPICPKCSHVLDPRGLA